MLTIENCCCTRKSDSCYRVLLWKVFTIEKKKKSAFLKQPKSVTLTENFIQENLNEKIFLIYLTPWTVWINLCKVMVSWLLPILQQLLTRKKIFHGNITLLEKICNVPSTKTLYYKLAPAKAYQEDCRQIWQNSGSYYWWRWLGIIDTFPVTNLPQISFHVVTVYGHDC